MTPMDVSPIRSRRRSLFLARTPLNDSLAFVLLALVALIPLPLGSNNPISWAVNAAAVGVVGLSYCLLLLARRDSLRVELSRYPVEAVLWFCLLGFIVFQTLPLGAWGIALHAQDVEGQRYAIDRISLTPAASLFMVLRLASYALFLFLCLQVTANRGRALMLAEAALFVFAAHALVGLFSLVFFNDVLLIFEKWAYQGVATGTFVNRNSFATFLALGLVVGVGLTLRGLTQRVSDRGQRLPGQDERLVHGALMIVATLIIFAALMATQSRMGLFAGLSGAFLLVIIAGFKLRSGRLRTIFLASGAIGAAFFVILFGFGSGTLERLGSVESASDVRLALYRQVMEMIGANWALGTGGGSFEIAYTLFHRWPVSPDLVWDKAHNTYLSLWSELGLIAGSIPIVVFVLFGVRLCWLIVRRSEDWWLPLISLVSIIIISVHSLVDFSMEIQGVVYATLFIIALGLDTRSRASSSPSEPRSGEDRI